jgi:predicted lipoprotein
MLKISTIVCVLAIALPAVGHAACSADDAANKSTAVADVLSDKLSSNADAASKMMSEMGTIMGGPVTDATCTKLDDLMVRAKKL